MTEPFEDELDDASEKDETEAEDGDRAPQPGNTPAPDEPPRESGAITGYDDQD